MRVLVTIPHFFGPSPGHKAEYGSEIPDAAQQRATALDQVIAGLRQSLGPKQWQVRSRYRAQTALDRANALVSATALDIVVVTTPGDHLLDRLTVPSDWYRREPVDGDPRMLGFACHDVLAAAATAGAHDWFCYLEDDVCISDPWFLRKIAMIEERTEGALVLMPNRFERARGRRIEKFYVDGPVSKRFTDFWQDVSADSDLVFTFLGLQLRLVRASNPHAGCFFLSRRQFDRWRARPYFGDQDQSFMGPMESAATLGPMKTFRLFKPAAENAGFLEAEHLNNRIWLPVSEM